MQNQAYCLNMLGIGPKVEILNSHWQTWSLWKFWALNNLPHPLIFNTKYTSQSHFYQPISRHVHDNSVGDVLFWTHQPLDSMDLGRVLAASRLLFPLQTCQYWPRIKVPKMLGISPQPPPRISFVSSLWWGMGVYLMLVISALVQDKYRKHTNIVLFKCK